MVKIILISVGSLALVGCSWFGGTRINTDVQDRYVEVLSCPAPPEIARPVLPIHQMTPEQAQKDGEVVKHWKATVKTLLGYSEELEKVVENQKQINKAYETKKKELEDSKNQPTE